MTRTAAPPKLEVRLRSRQALRDAMKFNRLTIRELSLATGDMRHRSTIGHLSSGARTSCGPALARRIEESLRLYPGALFDLRVCMVDMDHAATVPTTRGRRAA